jgi:ubiquinone/menaquinone biosynthesis C-methylase UbiE/uncharacterized protein YbaR (Trm112 family)
MKDERRVFGDFMEEIRVGFAEGLNVSRALRHEHRVGRLSASDLNRLEVLYSYDLQAGSYIDGAQKSPEQQRAWCEQLASYLNPVLGPNSSLLEVGVGEATTLAGVLAHVKNPPKNVLGFDLSWSRVHVGKRWLQEQSMEAEIFVADLRSIPLEDSSVDLVYSSHSLEPNRGNEKELVAELIRVARETVILFEPIYELASKDSQARMDEHGYVRNLLAACEESGAKVERYELMGFSKNLRNPSGVIVLRKNLASQGMIDSAPSITESRYRCPVTLRRLKQMERYFAAPEVGFVYPILEGIPLLRPEHAVVASLATEKNQ